MLNVFHGVLGGIPLCNMIKYHLHFPDFLPEIYVLGVSRLLLPLNHRAQKESEVNDINPKFFSASAIYSFSLERSVPPLFFHFRICFFEEHESLLMGNVITVALLKKMMVGGPFPVTITSPTSPSKILKLMEPIIIVESGCTSHQI